MDACLHPKPALRTHDPVTWDLGVAHQLVPKASQPRRPDLCSARNGQAMPRHLSFIDILQCEVEHCLTLRTEQGILAPHISRSRRKAPTSCQSAKGLSCSPRLDMYSAESTSTWRLRIGINKRIKEMPKHGVRSKAGARLSAAGSHC